MQGLFISGNDRGKTDLGWLQGSHSFSFSDYYDPDRMGFADLRVINEDVISPGKGFDTHPHKNMEIVTYVISGGLKHKDTLGNEALIGPGEVQRMSAGSGIFHSEYNASSDLSTHLLQIWLLPDENDIQPGYEQKDFSKSFEERDLTLVVSQTGRDGSLSIHQDVDLHVGKFERDSRVMFQAKADSRRIWLQMIEGGMEIGDKKLVAGDGFGMRLERGFFEMSSSEGAEFLLFDMKE